VGAVVKGLAGAAAVMINQSLNSTVHLLPLCAGDARQSVSPPPAGPGHARGGQAQGDGVGYRD